MFSFSMQYHVKGRDVGFDDIAIAERPGLQRLSAPRTEQRVRWEIECWVLECAASKLILPLCD